MSFDLRHVIKTKPRLYTESGVFCKENAMNTIYNLERLSADTNVAFDKALDAFEEVCLNLNESEINTVCDFLQENVDKVRDANQLINSIKYRNGRLKTKVSTKINQKINTVNGMVKYYVGSLDDTVPKGLTSGIANTTKQEACIDRAYNKLLERAERAKNCDRILENYNKLCKRFNVDKLICESDSSVYEKAYTIASYIDTYSITLENAYNIALEAAYYGLSSHYIRFENSDIIKGVTDYYIFNEEGVKDDLKGNIEKAKDKSLIFTDKDFDIIDFMYHNYIDDTSIDQIDPESYANNYGCIVKETLTQTIKDGIKNKRSKEDVMTDKVDDMLDEFRHSVSKNANSSTNPTTFKGIINKIFATNVDTVIYGLPNIMSILVTGFIIGGSFAISVPLGILAAITAGIVKLTVDRGQLDKILKIYDKEFARAKKKAENAKDESSKEKWTKYKDALKEDVEKIRTHFKSLYTEEEQDNMDDYSKNYSFDNDYDFGDDDDFDFSDFDESTIVDLSAATVLSEIMTSISEAIINPSDLDGIIADNIVKLSPDSIDGLTDFVIDNPVILEKRKYKDCLESYREDLRKDKTANNYILIDTINNSLYKLEHTPVSEYDQPTDMKSLINELSAINAIIDMKNTYYFNELGFVNSLKLAANNLKRAAVSLSDKEKQASNSIDIAVNSMTKSMEKALMVENRESVIKGSIIPSASKCIKIALTMGVAWAISPAIAVITAIGSFAVSSKLRNKERQIILDDIELELKMCERYIRQAEDKNDLKKIRELEKIQRNLQRQHQRIKYNMRVDFNQNVPDVKGSDED